ncbi:MAG: cation transporter [Desulfuromonadales bacterium]|nr:cation transporter [Desulfuromonadales bacterium]MDT8424114.1 cation transporter [Desulfuromonadales bacterium]
MWQGWITDKALAVYDVKNLSCGSCVSNIQKALADEAGVGTVKVSVTSAQSTVEFDPGVIDAEDIRRQLTDAGYPATVREILSVDQYRQLRDEETRLSPIYVARIGSRLLPRSEFAAAIKQSQSHGSALADADIRLKVWNDLLQRELLLGAAEENQVVVQDGEVAARIDSMKAQQPGFEQAVVARYGSLEQFTRLVRNEMIIQRNLELNVAPEGADTRLRNQRLQKWYQELVSTTPVVIFDPELKAATESSAGGCGGSCCG